MINIDYQFIFRILILHCCLVSRSQYIIYVLKYSIVKLVEMKSVDFAVQIDHCFAFIFMTDILFSSQKPTVFIYKAIGIVVQKSEALSHYQLLQMVALFGNWRFFLAVYNVFPMQSYMSCTVNLTHICDCTNKRSNGWLDQRYFFLLLNWDV